MTQFETSTPSIQCIVDSASMMETSQTWFKLSISLVFHQKYELSISIKYSLASYVRVALSILKDDSISRDEKSVSNDRNPTAEQNI